MRKSVKNANGLNNSNLSSRITDVNGTSLKHDIYNVSDSRPSPKCANKGRVAASPYELHITGAHSNMYAYCLRKVFRKFITDEMNNPPPNCALNNLIDDITAARRLFPEERLILCNNPVKTA